MSLRLALGEYKDAALDHITGITEHSKKWAGLHMDLALGTRQKDLKPGTQYGPATINAGFKVPY